MDYWIDGFKPINPVIQKSINPIAIFYHNLNKSAMVFRSCPLLFNLHKHLVCNMIPVHKEMDKWISGLMDE